MSDSPILFTSYIRFTRSKFAEKTKLRTMPGFTMIANDERSESQLKAQAIEDDRRQVGHVDADQTVGEQLKRHLDGRCLL